MKSKESSDTSFYFNLKKWFEDVFRSQRVNKNVGADYACYVLFMKYKMKSLHECYCIGALFKKHHVYIIASQDRNRVGEGRPAPLPQKY